MPMSTPSATRRALAATYNTGQDCTAATRVYVERSAHDRRGRRARPTRCVDHASVLRDDRATDIGPLISADHRDRVARLRRACRPPAARGRAAATCSTATVGSTRPRSSPASTQDSELVQDEVFGPVLAVVPFDDEDAGDRARQRHALRAGVVGVDLAGRPRPAGRPPDQGRRHLGQRPPADRQRDAARRSWRIGLRQGHGPRRGARLHGRPTT